MRGGVPSSTTRRTREWRGRRSAGRWRMTSCSGPPLSRARDSRSPARAWAPASCEILAWPLATAAFAVADSFPRCRSAML